MFTEGDFGKIELIEKKIISNGSMKDIVTDYIFKNNFPLYEELIKEVQRLERALSIEKGTEKWLECTHEMKECTKDTITIRFREPYCG